MNVQNLPSKTKQSILPRITTRFGIGIVLFFLVAVIISGCGAMLAISGQIPGPSPEEDNKKSLPPVFGPEAVRETALTFIRANYGSKVPPANLIWIGGRSPSSDFFGSSTFQYVTDNWVARVTFPVAAPEATIYTVMIQGEEMVWEGLVDANGQVATTAVSYFEPVALSTEVPAPSPTSTPIPPTRTPQMYCDWLAFVKDVTIPDGTTFKTGATFVKTWRLQNRGTCTWTPDYALVFSSGNQMGDTVAVKLPGYVAPGTAIDLSIALTAPSTPGNHRGYWMMRNSSGSVFGYGDNANKAFYVDIQSISSSLGTVSGKICYPSEHIPAMTLFLQNMSKNKLFRFPIQENQNNYQFQLEPGEYMAYAWTLNFEFAGGYTQPDHRLKSFNVNAGTSVTGIDICDWYGDPGFIPLPKDENYGTITGKLSFPSEQIPPLRIVAFDIYNDAYHWVDTVTNQQAYEITGLMPGYYSIIAYEKNSGFAGGYTEYAKCGFLSNCLEDHTLVTVYVTPGVTINNINPADWYAPADAFPPDPTR